MSAVDECSSSGFRIFTRFASFVHELFAGAPSVRATCTQTQILLPRTVLRSLIASWDGICETVPRVYITQRLKAIEMWKPESLSPREGSVWLRG
jgi:hypothetical protein